MIGIAIGAADTLSCRNRTIPFATTLAATFSVHHGSSSSFRDQWMAGAAKEFIRFVANKLAFFSFSCLDLNIPKSKKIIQNCTNCLSKKEKIFEPSYAWNRHPARRRATEQNRNSSPSILDDNKPRSKTRGHVAFKLGRMLLSTMYSRKGGRHC